MEPSYLKLYRSGELEKRLSGLEKMLESCTVCPRDCGTNRFNHEQGFCLADYDPLVSSVCDHHGEEPVLSGVNGSGTVFFGSCNLRCVYCQNHQISQTRSYFSGLPIKTDQLAKQIVALQNDKGVHNINFVSPSHFVPQMVRTIYEAIPMGLRVPIVYNTNAYDSLAVIKLLDGIVDIYLPDLKYDDDHSAEKYSRGLNYTHYAHAAIKEMYRQVGNLKVDKNGIALRGLIVRHLILPNDIAGSNNVLKWLAKELSNEVTVSLMSQYHPMHQSAKHSLLSRHISYNEYLSAVETLEKLNLHNSYTQEMDAPEHYLPDFSKKDHPFER
ncbi:MAG: radical SAM protein [Calditrichaceae bacterium]